MLPVPPLLLDLLFTFNIALSLVILLAFRARQTERWALAVLSLFGIAAAAVCFMDGKNWFYHRLPATVVAAPASASSCSSRSRTASMSCPAR